MTYSRYQQNIPSQGFYSPWMPGPNIGQGVQGFIERLQQQKASQQGLEQQQWKRGITEQEMGQTERGLGLRERELVSREKERESIEEYRKRGPAQVQLAKALVDSGYVDDMGKAMPLAMGIQKPEEALALLEEELKLKEKYRPEDLFDKRMGLGKKLVGKGLLDEGTLGMMMMGAQGMQPSLTPATIATNRRIIFEAVNKIIRGVTAGREGDPEDIVLDPKVVEEFANRQGIYLWAPNKYSQIKQAQALNPKLVTEEELMYVKQVEYTKAYFDKYLKGTEIPLEVLPPEESEKMDTETLTMLYRIYNPEKRSKFLGIF